MLFIIVSTKKVRDQSRASDLPQIAGVIRMVIDSLELGLR